MTTISPDEDPMNVASVVLPDVPRRKLRTEQNTRTIERKIRGAFRHWARRRTFETFFEHGQWWVRQPAGTTFSVCDSSDPSGFCFERID